MAFDFSKVFKDALAAGVDAARPGGQMAEDWIREAARANESSLRGIAVALATKQISRDTGAMLLEESGNALQAEAAALAVIVRATAQAAANAFLKSLSSALSAALKLAL